MEKKFGGHKVSVGTWPTPDRPVRVVLPARVAHDLGAFQKVQASVLGRLGCGECSSGFDIRYDLVSSFVVDEELNIRELVGDFHSEDG